MHRIAQRHALVLASASPRRRELLAQLGLQFQLRPSAIPEPPHTGEPPEDYARTLAARKARAVADALPTAQRDAFVLGADTIVVIDERVLGKPVDDAEGQAMLLLLQGRSHLVITAVCLRRADGYEDVLAVRSSVRFRALDAAAAARYVASGEGQDKAGSYAIQGLGTGLVCAVEGSYSNVVGLPACETLDALQRAGVIEGWP